MKEKNKELYPGIFAVLGMISVFTDSVVFFTGNTLFLQIAILGKLVGVLMIMVYYNNKEKEGGKK